MNRPLKLMYIFMAMISIACSITTFSLPKSTPSHQVVTIMVTVPVPVTVVVPPSPSAASAIPRNEDVILLECLGDIEGPRWLDGRTGDGTVGLAPTTSGFYTGTRWRVVDMGDGSFAFECLGDIEGPRWLDGRTGDGTVGLAPTTGGFYTGTRWRIVITNR